MGTFGDLLTKGTTNRMNFGLLFVFIIFISLIFLSYVTLAYLTKFGFKSKRSSDGQQCVTMSKSEMTIIKVGLVVIWLYIFIDIITSIFVLIRS